MPTALAPQAAFALEPLPTIEQPLKAGSSCASLQPEEVEALFERWNGALTSGNPDSVAALYAEEALLLPTLSAESRSSPEAISSYFRDFLARSPRGEVTSRQVFVGCNEAIDAGTYRFALQDPKELVDARYTFVYGFDGTNWRILHHHSSLMPS